MFTLLTNTFVFFSFLIILAVQFIFSSLFNFDKSMLWLLSIIVYSLFLIYQVIIVFNSHYELNKTKKLLIEILTSIKGIPIINEQERIIIKWDIVFKELIEEKKYYLYDKIVKFKTKKIDYYINRHPSILLNDSFMNEFEYNKELNTFLGKQKNKEEGKELEIDVDLETKLFINDVSDLKATFTNYDSSIIIDAVLVNEYEPSNYEELGVEPDLNYDGFSLHMYYDRKRYTVVPRFIIENKRIDKTRWFYDNLKMLLDKGNRIIAKEEEYSYLIDKFLIADYLQDIETKVLPEKPLIWFDTLKENSLIFKMSESGKESAVITCSFSSSSNNSFEISLETFSSNSETKEFHKTVALGNSYDPMIYILEKMPLIIKNIEHILNSEDIENVIL